MREMWMKEGGRGQFCLKGCEEWSVLKLTGSKGSLTSQTDPFDPTENSKSSLVIAVVVGFPKKGRPS